MSRGTWLALLVSCATPRPPAPADTSTPDTAPSVPAVVEEDTGVPPSVAAHRVAPPPGQVDRALAHRAKTVIEAQPWRRTTSIAIPGGTATLVDLNPAIHVWFALVVSRTGKPDERFHLENPAGTALAVSLDPDFPTGLVLTADEEARRCDLWGTTQLADARASGKVYAPICDDALYLRRQVEGERTTLEWTTDFLRDHVWGGDQLTNAVKETLYADFERETSGLGGSAPAPRAAGSAPPTAQLAPEAAGHLVFPVELGLSVDDAPAGGLAVGAWYPLEGVTGGWVSAMEPRYVDPALADRLRPDLDRLDDAEDSALVYTLAFDLSRFDLGYEVGSDHPRVGWSERALASQVDPSLPGPDGYADVAPLARTGMLDPAYQSREVAVFVGGFKRIHGAFRSGALATVNSGSHAGFVEYGTVLSKLQPGLATLVVWEDGTVDLRTWSADDDARLPEVRHARQNGVPVLETDPSTGLARPGSLVTHWAAGNWSGSATGTFRSVRAGVCLVDRPEGRFLLYSYFSDATPSAMAEVWASYGCSYGMLLDMNALEHTYLAVNRVRGGELSVEHLVRGMDVLDKQKHGHTWPRFTGYADNRDFFYVLAKP